MNENSAHEDIAFIRRTIEQGRQAAGTWSADTLVWGVAIAAGYLGTYAEINGLWSVNARWLWVACILLPWLYSLRRLGGRLVGVQSSPACSPMTLTLRRLWLGCGIALSILGFTCLAVGARDTWWMNPVVAGVLGLGFFVSSFLCNLAWMRWVAVAWWIGELAMVLWHGAESFLLMAALMLALFALPGLVLMRRRPLAGAA
jgi:hypothetical protein